jgi:hypothetical protein
MNLYPLLYRVLSRLPFEPKRRLYRLEVEAKDIELLTIKDFVSGFAIRRAARPRKPPISNWPSTKPAATSSATPIRIRKGARSPWKWGSVSAI